ncbi:hypothetical protein QL093DRAFT_2405023, partial [Fusarium oxysporum]
MNHSILSRATLTHHRQSASYKRDVAPHELVDGSGRGELTAELHATLGQTAIRTPTRPFIFMGNMFQDSLGAPLDNWPIHCFEESHELQPRRINNVKRPRLFFFIDNAFRLLEEFSGAGGKSTAHPQPGCPPPPPPLLFLSFATKIPGVHRGSICNIILSSLFSSSRFNCCVRLLHIVYGRIASTSTSSIGVDVYECVDWMDWTETVCM